MIYIGADHRGFHLKEQIKQWLDELGYEYEDLGALELDPNDDYTQYAKLVAERISINPDDRGVVICGSGVGVDITANRFPGVRAGLAIDADQIHSARNDDDINVLALAADEIPEDEARHILETFLETEFSNDEKYLRRIEDIDDIE